MPLPRTEAEQADERGRLEERERREVEADGFYDWRVYARAAEPHGGAGERDRRARLELAPDADVEIEPILEATPSFVLSRTWF